MSIDRIARVPIYIRRGALNGDDGPWFQSGPEDATDPSQLTVFDSTATMRVTHPAGSFDLTVANGGITLAAGTLEGVGGSLANAQIRWVMTKEQSRLIPVGNYSHYEVQTGAAAAEKILVTGPMIGQGGDNADG